MEVNVSESVRLLQRELSVTRANLDDFFITVSTILIFAMQAGFSLMETGLVRSKNATNILLKSTLDAFIGATAYWLIGYAFAFGDGNEFIGWTGFALHGVPSSKLSFFFYQTIFSNTASTITSGSVAERMAIPGFFVYSFLMTGVMYPIAARWTWHKEGWLRVRGFIDFGGSGVVHMLGGVCALVATLFIGPRTGRTKSSRNMFRGHSITLTGIGAFLLMFGIMGYNMSAQLTLTNPGDGTIVAISTINTLLAGSSASLTALFLARTTPSGKYRWSYLTMINGAISGMVSSCAGCNAMPLWGAYVTGICAGLIFFALRSLLHYFIEVDDTLDGFAVHFGGGFAGMLAAPIVSNDGVLLVGDSRSAEVLGYQVAGILVLIAWGAFFCTIMFALLKYLNILRIDARMEFYGMDIVKHNEPAYPAEAWEEKQYSDYQSRQVVQLLQSSMANQNVPAAIDSGRYSGTQIGELMLKVGLPPTMNFSHLALTMDYMHSKHPPV